MCGWAGAGNVGDELLTRAIAGLLTEAGAAPVVASRDPRATTTAHPGVEAIHWGPRGLTALGGIDGVCVGPGGIIQDTSSRWSLPGHLVLAARLARHGVPVAGVGLGAEPLRRPGSARRLRRVLGGRPVLCRDAASAEVLRAAGVEAEATCDLAFCLDFGAAQAGPPGRDRIAVAIGPGVEPGSWRPAASRLQPDDPAAIASAIDDHAARLGLPVTFVAFRGERDRRAALDVAARLRAPSELVAGDVDEQVGRVRGARLVLTSRYHPVVVAAASGTPGLVVSPQAKVRSLVAQLDDPLIAPCATWADAGRAAVAAPRTVGLIPPGVARLRDVVDGLVADATARARRRAG